MEKFRVVKLLIVGAICISVIAATRNVTGGGIVTAIACIATALYTILVVFPRASPQDCARVITTGNVNDEVYWQKQCALFAAKHAKAYFLGKWNEMRDFLRTTEGQDNSSLNWFRVCCVRLRAERIALRYLMKETTQHAAVERVLEQLGTDHDAQEQTSTTLAILAGCDDAVLAHNALRY